MKLGSFLHVRTDDNPADLGTRKTLPTPLNDLWRYGPRWLTNPEDEPEQPDIFDSEEAQSEEIKSMFMTIQTNEENLLEEMCKR